MWSVPLMSTSQFKHNQLSQSPRPHHTLRPLSWSQAKHIKKDQSFLNKDYRRTRENSLGVFLLKKFISFFLCAPRISLFFLHKTILFPSRCIKWKKKDTWVCRNRGDFCPENGGKFESDGSYLFLGGVWYPCSSQRGRWLFCSSAEWCYWAAVLKGQCCLAMPLHNAAWSCKDTWTSRQSRPPLLPAPRDRMAKDLVCYNAGFLFLKHRNLSGFQSSRDVIPLLRSGAWKSMLH